MKTIEKSRLILDKTHDMFNSINATVQGDHNGSSVIIPNVCNIKSKTFNNGFASELAKNYSASIKNYEILSDSQRKLGYCQIVEAYKNNKYNHKLYIANMMCQVGFNSRQSNARKLNYSAMNMCFLKIEHFIQNYIKETQSNIQIHTHKYLVNYTGADNRFVAYLLEDVFDNRHVSIYLK